MTTPRASLANGPAATAQARLARLVAAGVAYWIAGRLALLMAIPPGYATAVWPAAGIALAAVLLWGRGVWPGLALGSFLVNVGTSFDGSSPAAVVRSIAIPSIIGLGAALQAVAGAAVVRRFVVFPTTLEQDRDILRLVVLGGPIASVVSPSLGVSALCTAGIVPWASFAFNWWTWWVGDSIGVLIVTPLMLLLAAPSAAVPPRRRAAVAAPLAAGFTLVTLLFVRVSAWENTRLETDFERRAAPLVRSIETRFAAYEDIVRSIAALFDASASVSRREFEVFSRGALERYPGIQGLGWNPLVPAAARAAYEAAARGDGIDGYQFTEYDDRGDLIRARDRPVYAPAYYLEPRRTNLRALGFDVASEATRRAALERARESGDPTATSPLTLVQEEGAGIPGVLLVAPVFASPTSQAAGRPPLRGYAVGVFRIRDVVETAVRGLDREGLAVVLEDSSAPAPHQGLYATGTAGAPDRRARRWSATFEFGQRRWRASVSATAVYMGTHRSWQGWIVLAGGLFFVGLLGVVLLTTTGHAAATQHNLEQRAREASRAIQAREQFRLAIEAAPTGMIMVDHRGIMVLLNAHAESLFGYSRDELIGQPVEMLVPERVRDEHAGFRAAFAGNATPRPMGRGRDLHGLRKDATEVPIEIALNPIRTPDGDFVLSSIVDITERKLAERERDVLLEELRSFNAELEDRVRTRTSQLTATLSEREVLLQEIHHRVKNNLQVISSLINLQLHRLARSASRDALEECQTRVQAIALIHERLYQSADYAQVHFSLYVRRLVESIVDATHISPGTVSVHLALDDVSLAVDKAIPCGLILNELITNALKHAFPRGRRGNVSVELRHPEPADTAHALLAVRDDGVGIADGRAHGTDSLGLQLVRTLAKQLDATLDMSVHDGSSFELVFPIKE